MNVRKGRFGRMKKVKEEGGRNEKQMKEKEGRKEGRNKGERKEGEEEGGKE